MEILVIYDKEGLIISRSSGSVKEPVGIPFMWLEIPQGKTLVSIDTSSEEHVPVFEDMPKSEIEFLKEQIALQEQSILELSMLLYGGV